MRKGVNRLAMQVETMPRQDPFACHVFVFRGHGGDLVKNLWWSGEGLCVFAKCLECGRFSWTRTNQGLTVLTPAQLPILREWIDWRHPARTVPPEFPGCLRPCDSADGSGGISRIGRASCCARSTCSDLYDSGHYHPSGHYRHAYSGRLGGLGRRDTTFPEHARERTKKPLKAMGFQGRDLVAGIGFEPMTFRL